MGVTSALVGIGPLLLGYAAVASAALWIVQGWKRGGPVFQAVLVGAAAAVIVLTVGLPLLWNLLPLHDPFRTLPQGIVTDDGAVRAYASLAQWTGAAVYGVAFLAALWTAGVFALWRGSSAFRSIGLTAAVLLAFFVTPFFIWLEFFTQCATGHAALLHGAVLCG